MKAVQGLPFILQKDCNYNLQEVFAFFSKILFDFVIKDFSILYICKTEKSFPCNVIVPVRKVNLRKE